MPLARSILRFFKPRKPVQSPTWSESGVFHIADGGLAIGILWPEVTAVYAYKKDCFAVDQIRLIIVSEAWQIEFTEDDENFAGLRDCLSTHLPIRSDWHQVLVTSPAFKTTWTVVYPDDVNKVDQELG